MLLRWCDSFVGVVAVLVAAAVPSVVVAVPLLLWLRLFAAWLWVVWYASARSVMLEVELLLYTTTTTTTTDRLVLP